MAYRVFDVLSGCADVVGQEEAAEDGLVQILFHKLVTLVQSGTHGFPSTDEVVRGLGHRQGLDGVTAAIVIDRQCVASRERYHRLEDVCHHGFTVERRLLLLPDGLLHH